MTEAQPQRTREYRSYILDSRNWDHFRPRWGDVVISTSYKSGTTWMQNIVRQLVFPGPEKPAVSAVSPWIDRRNPDFAATAAMLEAQAHRRFVKSHLPLDALPYRPEARYIVVVRDPRDVFMSFWNHYSSMNDGVYAWANGTPGRVGPEMPRCPDDIHDLWAAWISRGWFPWETEGWPHHGNLYHASSWWRFRHLENILFVHFADLLADLPGEIARVAAHLGISCPDAARIARAVNFDALRRDAAAAAPMTAEAVAFAWRNGHESFFFKGTNGRWRDVLTADELALYARAKARCLTPGCAAYLEGGRAAWREPKAHGPAGEPPPAAAPLKGRRSSDVRRRPA